MKIAPLNFKHHNSIEVSKSKLLFNYDYLEKISGQKVFPVIKSNAYGHGIEEVVEILKERKPVYVAVNDYLEALRVRAASNQPVLIMGAIDPANIGQLNFENFTYMVQDLGFTRALGETCKPIKIHVDIDTGMKRYGFDAYAIPSLLELLKEHPNLEVEGIATHLADGDNPEEAFTHEQVSYFDKTIERIMSAGHEPKWFHVSNTPGLLKVKSKYANSFRAGIGLYGVNPLEPKDTGYAKLQEVKPTLKLKSTITFIRDIGPGEGISYGRTWRASKPTTIGVLPAGYYEGIPRSLSNNGVVTSGKSEYPIVGRVCMNHLMIDITGAQLKVGDHLVVISDNPKDKNSIEQMSKDYYFFSYGLLAKLNADIKRIIIN